MTTRINAQTQLYGIIGHPVSHSLSPIMHNTAFESLSINAVYLAFDVVNIRNAIIGIKELGIKGLSVTIPHKEAIMEFVDIIDENAQKIGAVNTLLIRDNQIYGFNTDWLGAILALQDHTELSGKKCVILGAGGSSRAICYGLKRNNAYIHILNRNIERARDLAEEFDGTYSHIDSPISGDILINTTSVGMKGTDTEGKLPIKEEYIKNFQIVMDIVYSPLETPLLKVARESGLVCIDGLKMLLYQGVKQFEIWTGKNPPIELMQKALYNAIL